MSKKSKSLILPGCAEHIFVDCIAIDCNGYTIENEAFSIAYSIANKFPKHIFSNKWHL
jgi:hypothetical protein